ncbi:alpha/beta hydrolase family protein [Kribbella deserti]|uniref:Alpha/beta hydrolase family protein n=1 Tax=Kribbella deserti TaxID=1926257 RepID=A0ABV6QNY6_9ACTN
MTTRRRFCCSLALIGLGAAAGCSGDPDTSPSPSPTGTASPSPSPSSMPSPAQTTPAPSASPTASPVNPVSMQALIQKKYDGRGLRLGRVLDRNAAYTRYAITYLSGRLTISGVLNVPNGAGPYPAVVLNHGYIDPAIYTTGRGLAREQDYLARRGFIVLHTDYRNHAGSSDDPRADLNLRIGYVEDVVNAVHAVKAAPKVAPNRIGMLGRSMGGGITYSVLAAQPGLIDAAVVFASTSSDAAQNFNHFIRNDRGNAAITSAVIKAHGSPEARPEFWRNMSPVNFFDRVTEPVLIHHGDSDDTCPIAWSRAAHAALTRAGKRSALHVYPGEQHAFDRLWPLSMQRTVAFLRQNLRD